MPIRSFRFSAFKNFVLFSFFLLLIFQSCKKIDISESVLSTDIKPVSTIEQSKDFFTISEKAPDPAKTIAKEMQGQFKEKDIQDFINWHGLLLWSRVIKFEQAKNGTVTYAIPSQKNGVITGYIAATIDKGNAIKFEMHRKSAIEAKKTEYSYAGINVYKSKLILDIFSNTLKIVSPQQNNLGELYCWYTWVEQTTFQGTSSGSNKIITTQSVIIPGGYWVTHCTYSGGGGTGGDPGGGGTGGNTNCGGGGGGGTQTFANIWWGNESSSLTPCELVETINRLSISLGLSTGQIQWLLTQPERVVELDRFVGGGGDQQANQIAKDHLEKMMADNQYLTFVVNHAQTGDPLKMWWEDDVWLQYINYIMNENIFNFYMDATTVKNPRPIEFADKCAGVPSMIQVSASDKKERVGYITLDGQFIYSPHSGTSGDVEVGIRIRNGQAYYNYKMNLGAPTRNYFGMIVDNEIQEYLIPVRTAIHTHIPDFGNNGAAITITNSIKSDDDKKVADLIQRNLSGFNLYVVEVKDNGKYLVADFAFNVPDYTIVGDDLILPNPDVCNLLN